MSIILALPAQKLVLNAFTIFTGTTPSNATFNAHVAYITANGEAAYTSFLNSVAKDIPVATLASNMLTNLGLTAAFTQAQAVAYLTSNASNLGGAMTNVANAVLNYVSDTANTNNAELLAAQTAWTNTATNALAYSSATTSTSSGSMTATAAGTTFTLTTGTDTFTGAGTADTFNAVVNNQTAASNSLDGFDNINGGAGLDSLLLNSTGNTANNLGAATIAGIETLTVRATSTGGFTGALAGLGVTTANNDRSTDAVTFTGMGADGIYNILGNAATTNGASNLGYAAAATAGALNIAGGVTAGAIAITGTGLTSQVINSTGAANIVGAITVAATTTGLTLNATTGLTSTGTMVGAGLTTITVNGAAATGPTAIAANILTPAVNIGVAPATVTTIDASGMTAGGVGVGLVATVTSFKGGAGSDVVTTAALTNTTASIIDAGTGTDVLVAGAYANINTAAKAAQYAGFETLDTGTLTGTAVNMALFTNSTITGLATGVAAASSFSNVTAAQAANVTVYGSQITTTTIAVKDATVNGNLDTLTLNFTDGLTAKSTFTLASLVAAGVETLNVNSNDNAVISLLTSATSLNKIVVTGSGTTGITTGAVAVNTNTVVDASAATGVFTFNGTSATAQGYKITGSATVVNNVTTAALDDILIGGTANDIFTAGAGNNTLTGGGGADSFVMAAGGATPSATAFHTITDFSKAAGVATFDTISAAALVLGVQTATAAAGVATITGGLATFNAADTTFAQHLAAVAASLQTIAGATAIWQEGADAYVYIADNILTVAATDTLIKLTGVTAGALTVATNAITAIA